MGNKVLIRIFIPENGYGIEPDNYTLNDYAQLLRDNKNFPNVVQFLADMMEE